jgi:NDP-sugar pyrophosphorylase family protein
MTQDYSVASFFDLSHCAHASLFDGCSYPWQALQRLASYLSAQTLGQIETEIPDSAHLINPALISIGPGTRIEPGTHIQGPCIIGPECTIRSGAYIRGHFIAEAGCIIGHNTEVKHSIFLNNACAAHFNYVGDSILGCKANLGAGVKCANFRFDRQNVMIEVGTERLDTQLKKMGAIIGDGVQVGCNCVLNPGTLLGKHALCFPCLNVHGIIPERARVRPAQKNSVECQ